MEGRRPPLRTSNDPVIRQVGFLTTTAATNIPVNGVLVPSSSPPIASLSPVMIPLPAIPDTSLPRPVPVPRRPSSADTILARSPPSHDQDDDDADFDDDDGGGGGGSNIGGAATSPVPTLGFNMSGVNSIDDDSAPADANNSHTSPPSKSVPHENNENKVSEKMNDNKLNLKSTNPKLTRAERRAVQEAQRAAKAETKVSSSRKPVGVDDKAGKVVKQPLQKKDASPAASFPVASIKKGVDRSVDNDKKRDVCAPRMQYDDKKRVEKANKRSIVKQTEAKNRVELFQHLRQYEHGSQVQDLEGKFFNVGVMHPAVYKVGLQHLAGDITGSNARCSAMLLALKEVIKDYQVPAVKVFKLDLTARISSVVSFISECQPLSVSMGNAIRFLKSSIGKLPTNMSELEAKVALCSGIDRFINEKIVIAEQVIVRHATTKIRDGDVLLTYGSSTAVEMILTYAHEQGKQFRVVIIDSRPMLEGQGLLRRLVNKGLNCTYTHINALSYIMHEVTLVLLGAASVLCNGTVYSRIGTASVAMVAHAFRVPVLVCCEAYKFHERVQLDSICSNELGDPDVISTVPGRSNINFLNNWTHTENLQLLNLLYDLTPSDYVSMIVTDYGMVPPTSVPVIVHEYRKEHMLL